MKTARRPVSAALLALAICTGFLLPAAVANAADDTAQTSEADEDGVVSVATDYSIHVDINPSRVALSEGKPLSVHGSWSTLNPTIDAPTSNAVEIRSRYASTDGVLAYRISMLGEPTPYWVKLVVATYGMDTPCEVYRGDPSAGGKPARTAPFSCHQSWRWESYSTDLRYTVDVGLNRAAEASGTITPRDLSLTGGTFKSDLPYTISGNAELAPGETTWFDAVLREGDRTVFENQARTEFAYEILEDDGTHTGLWAAGVSTNYRGVVQITGATCGIYDENPLLGQGRLDEIEPIESSEFFCKAKGGYADGRLHYYADFTVGRP